MATSQAGKAYTVTLIAQTIIGTPVTGAGGTVLRTLPSQGLSLNRAEAQSNEDRADGMSGTVHKGVKSAPATYNCPLVYTTHDPLFEAFMRSTFSIGLVLSPGSTKTFFTVDEYLADLDTSIQAETARLTSMAVKMPAEGMCEIAWGILARNLIPIAAGGTSPFLTGATPSTTEPMAGEDTIITGPAGMSFSSMDFSLTRGSGVQAVMNSAGLSPDVYIGNAKGTGTISGTVETLGLLTAVGADTPITLTAVCTDFAGNTIQFALSGVQLLDWNGPLGGDAAMIQSSKFSFGGSDALVITKVDA